MRGKIESLIIFVALIAIIVVGVCVGIVQKSKFDTAMIIQPDNTVVIGNLVHYSSASRNMYKLKMSNGKTYLVPYSRITLIDNPS